MIEQIDYPLELRNIVVIGRIAPRVRSLLMRPKTSGDFTFFAWPKFFPDKRWILRCDFSFTNQSEPPVRILFDLDLQKNKAFLEWEWVVLKQSAAKGKLPASEALLEAHRIAQGTILFEDPQVQEEVRTVIWSCHQPFLDEYGTLKVDPHTEAIMPWYERILDEFLPHVIWGNGDNSYSDGTKTSNLSDQVYNDEGWQAAESNKVALRLAYQRMYRYHWSFKELNSVLSTYPHILMWDDHEIHDGWGSEAEDFSPGNLAMFDIAKEAAQQYVLSVGPRVREQGDAHMAYIQGCQAAFLTDTRTSRHYQDPDGTLFSPQQLEDLLQFIDAVIADHQVKYFLLGTTVPFIYLKENVEAILSKIPKTITDLTMGIRDDARDSWLSPGNKQAMKDLLGSLRKLQWHRPDIHIINVSGDIHVANAFEIMPPGFMRPIYQVTSSAITNRSHIPNRIAQLITAGNWEISPELGLVRRLWQDIVDPNILMIKTTHEKIEFKLRVLPVDGSKNVDQLFELS